MAVLPAPVRGGTTNNPKDNEASYVVPLDKILQLVPFDATPVIGILNTYAGSGSGGGSTGTRSHGFVG